MTVPTGTVRVVVVAAGSHIFQAAHIPAIRAVGVQVAGVFDADFERATTVGAEHGWPVARTLDELLAIPADAAVVCAPHPLHADLVARCLDAGLAVLVEKPLAPRLSEIDGLIRRSAQTGRAVAVVHQHRLRAEVREAARLIRAGAIGRIHRAQIVASYPKRAVYYTDTPWRGTWRGEGGGVLLNQGLHDIDLLVHLLGRPARLAARLGTRVQPIQAEDAADLLIEWDTGATASVHITSAAPPDLDRFEVRGSAGALRLTVAGLELQRAEADFDDFARAPGGHFDAFAASPWQQVVAHAGGTHADVYADFVRAWEEDAEPLVTARGARDAVEVIAAAALASESSSWVQFPVDAGAFDDLLDARIAAAEGALA